MSITNTRTPKFMIAQRRILQWIRAEDHRAGDRLPAEQELAGKLGLNHRTVRRGLEELVKAGVIEKHPRVGNFVKYVRPRELTVSVALVCPRYLLDVSTEHPAIGSLIGGACRSLDHRDYSVTTLSYRPGSLWEDVGPALVERGVRGILLYPHREIALEEIQRFDEAGIHVVLAGPTRDQRILDAVAGAVWMGTSGALEEALQRVAALGHRRLVIASYTENPRCRESDAVLKAAMANHPEWGGAQSIIFDMPNREMPDFTRLERLLDRTPLPSAVIVPDEMCAAEFFRICYRRSIRIPDQMSLVSLVNNTPLAFPVALTSPDSLRHLAEVGSRAAEMLASVIDGRPMNERIVEIQARLLTGESLDAPAT